MASLPTPNSAGPMQKAPGYTTRKRSSRAKLKPFGVVAVDPGFKAQAEASRGPTEGSRTNTRS